MGSLSKIQQASLFGISSSSPILHSQKSAVEVEDEVGPDHFVFRSVEKDKGHQLKTWKRAKQLKGRSKLGFSKTASQVKRKKDSSNQTNKEPALEDKRQSLDVDSQAPVQFVP